MIFNPQKYQIFFYNDYVDMRKGHHSLAMLVTNKIKFEIMDGSLFVNHQKST